MLIDKHTLIKQKRKRKKKKIQRGNFVNESRMISLASKLKFRMLAYHSSNQKIH